MRLRLPLDWSAGRDGFGTRTALWSLLELCNTDDDLMLDVVDALMLVIPIGDGGRPRLIELLELGGSA